MTNDANQRSPLEISVEPGPTTTLTLVGELDPATAPLVDAAVATAVASGGLDQLVLDLQGIDFIDSAGLRVLVRAREALRSNGSALVLRSPSPNTLRLLEVSGLTDLLDVQEGA